MTNEEYAMSLGWRYGPTGYGDAWIAGRDPRWAKIPGMEQINTPFGAVYVIVSLPDNLQEYINT